jgi:hypothetical protein
MERNANGTVVWLSHGNLDGRCPNIELDAKLIEKLFYFLFCPNHECLCLRRKDTKFLDKSIFKWKNYIKLHFLIKIERAKMKFETM